MRRSGLTLIEVAVVLAILLLVVGIVLPFIGAMRRETRGMQRSTQIRGIHQAMVMYGQNNNGFFPGLVADPAGIAKAGVDAGVTVESRFETLLRDNYFTGEYLVSPSESLTAWTTGTLTSGQYSYALLQLPAAGARRLEWRETLNGDAPVVSDRAVRSNEQLHSVHTEPRDGWRGGIAYNDNHVVFEGTHIVPTAFAGVAHQADDLFTAEGDDDAHLIHSGNE